jgi:spore germination protein
MLVVRTIEMPGVFLERVDVFIYAVWLIQVFLLQSVMLYVLSLTVSRIMKIGEYKIFVWPLVPCVFFLSLFPLNIAQLSVFNTVTPVILASYVFILALALNLLSRGKGGNVRV